jgi:hypothetical protein
MLPIPLVLGKILFFPEKTLIEYLNAVATGKGARVDVSDHIKVGLD